MPTSLDFQRLVRARLRVGVTCGVGLWLGAVVAASAQTAPRSLPAIRPVPLPEHSVSGVADGALMPTELELLEQFAPELSIPGQGVAKWGEAAAAGWLAVPDQPIPVGNAGGRGDVSGVSLAQMPWNVEDTPDRTSPNALSYSAGPALGNPALGNPALGSPLNIGGGGLEVRAAPSLQPQLLYPWRYRVFIPAPLDPSQTAKLQAQLRAWVPDVFVTQGRGQRVLQLGSFGDRQRAIQQMQQLQGLGLWPQMEVITVQGQGLRREAAR